MATKFLFEDDETAPISMLLKKSYKGNDIYFSGGCSKLLSTALAIQNLETLLLFIVMWHLTIEVQQRHIMTYA